MDAAVNMDITVTVPSDFTVASCAKDTEIITLEHETIFNFRAETFCFNLAIAKYLINMLPIGKFYLLGEINSKQVVEIMDTAHGFMNARFGHRDIFGVKFISIPDKLGSFARQQALFVCTSAFESIKSMNQLIHEYIHLGWNVKADSESQRIRFFDEAFTSYFEMRVMEHITKENYRLSELINAYKNQMPHYDTNIPIVDYGKHEYGDLSYTAGAICLYKLSEFVGTDVFDNATRAFLEKYRDKPVNMDIFCEEYIRLCNNANLKQFFMDWIYTTCGIKSFIKAP